MLSWLVEPNDPTVKSYDLVKTHTLNGILSLIFQGINQALTDISTFDLFLYNKKILAHTNLSLS